MNFTIPYSDNIVNLNKNLQKYNELLDNQLTIMTRLIVSNTTKKQINYTFDFLGDIPKVVELLKRDTKFLIQKMKYELTLDGDFIIYKDILLNQKLIDLKNTFEEIYPKINFVINTYETINSFKAEEDPTKTKSREIEEKDVVISLTNTKKFFISAIKDINEILENFQPYLDRKLSLQERSLQVVKANTKMIPADHAELVNYYIANAENALEEKKTKKTKTKTSPTIGGKTKRKNKHIKKTMKKKYRKKL